MKREDKEVIVIWIVVIILLISVIAIPLLIATSDLPDWVKFWLLK
jgi:hypothetical protein